VVGIDIGGPKKGFHAVALRGRQFETYSSKDSTEIVNWCLNQKAGIVSVDAPCGWSESSSSRPAEQELEREKIHCFKTPTLDRARSHKKGFYEWVFNGQTLYEQLRASHYQLYDGGLRSEPLCFETFPHAIVCALRGKVIPAKQKNSTRRKVLRDRGYDDSVLRNIDFVDAALCAVTGENFRMRCTMNFGTRDEGIIVVPKFESLA
jgi:predicted nuclease with RNAse H fold